MKKTTEDNIRTAAIYTCILAIVGAVVLGIVWEIGKAIAVVKYIFS